MKIKFDNNSVSGVNRKYRGFVLDIPGQSTRTVDVPPQYVNDAISYLKYRHPAVICTPIVAEKTEVPPPVIEAPAPEQKTDAVAEKATPEAATESATGNETADAEVAVVEAKPAEAPATVEIAKAPAEIAKAKTATVAVPAKKGKANAKGKATKEIKGTEKKKTQKTGGKK